MKFFIVLRHTEEWDKMDTATYFSKPRPHHTGKPEHAALIKKNVEYWDTLPINLYEYRHKLKHMVFDMWNIECLSMQEALNIHDKDVIFIPMDDDDILHPNIVDVLTPIFEIDNLETASWNTWSFSTICCGPMFVRAHENVFDQPWYAGLLPSNCYAMRSTVANKELLTYHNKFSWIQYLNRFHLAKTLGMRCAHPGSTWLMQSVDMANNVHSKMVMDIPDDLLWAENFIKKLAEITFSNFHKTT